MNPRPSARAFQWPTPDTTYDELLVAYESAQAALAMALALLQESKLPYTGGLSFGEKRDAFLSTLGRVSK